MAKGRRGSGEGTIAKRSNGTYEAKISIEGGKRKTFYGKTRKEVQEKLKVALREQQQGMLVTAPQQKLEQFLQQWLEETQRNSVKPRSFERYEEIVRLHIVPVLGNVQIQKLTPQQVQSFYTKKIKEGYKAITVASFHNVLHKALDMAVRWNLVAKNVCDVVSPPRVEDFEIQPLTVEQIRKLLEVAKGHPMEALIKVAIATGLRRGELMALKWQDIDLTTGILQVQRNLVRIPSKLPGKGYIESETKTKKSRRSVVIASFALEALREHRSQQLHALAAAGPLWQYNNYVFCTTIGTHIHPTRDMADPLNELLEKAGLPHIRFHDLRHTAATLLMSQGVHPKVVQEFLGHSTITMTMDIYSHVLPTMQQDAISKMNDALNE